MKIDPGPKQVSLPTNAEHRTAKPQTGQAANTEQTDVSLSSRAGQLKELESQLAAIPVVDRARVESIKEAIATGQYTINTGNIAENLINTVKEMLHASR